DDLTWPEIKEAAARNTAVLIPVGAIEDHGRHLPLNTDNIIVEAVCFETARRSAGEVLSLPVIPVGLNEHHMDFPGTLSAEMDLLLKYVAQCAISLTRHGFTHVMIVNGHGSNASVCELAARKAVLASGAIVGAMAGNAAVSDALVSDLIARHRRSAPGGIGHACEYETAMMLHLRPDLVQMDKAVKETGQMVTPYFNWGDHPQASAYSWMDWWSRFSDSGVAGDPTAATAEFGALMFDETCRRMVEVLREFRQIPVRARKDHH
ncbi:MAG: creatininase family protein, partial [Chloroflexi bacterium]|nr:creatininase family protein [Chloroflexota bacterium]